MSTRRYNKAEGVVELVGPLVGADLDAKLNEMETNQFGLKSGPTGMFHKTIAQDLRADLGGVTFPKKSYAGVRGGGGGGGAG